MALWVPTPSSLRHVQPSCSVLVSVVLVRACNFSFSFSFSNLLSSIILVLVLVLVRLLNYF